MRTLLPAFLALLLHALWPDSGARRAATVRVGAPLLPVRRPLMPRRRGALAAPAHSAPLRGEEVALVRPYLLAYERRCEARLQRERRTALVLASMGVDYPVAAA